MKTFMVRSSKLIEMGVISKWLQSDSLGQIVVINWGLLVAKVSQVIVTRNTRSIDVVDLKWVIKLVLVFGYLLRNNGCGIELEKNVQIVWSLRNILKVSESYFKGDWKSIYREKEMFLLKRVIASKWYSLENQIKLKF